MAFTELEIKIFEATIVVFNTKGLKLTMDDLASYMSISKKTIYTAFTSKEELFSGMVDYIFDGIKAREEEILKDESLDTMSRIRNILSAMPDGYRAINFSELAPLKEKFPKVYKKMTRRMEGGWEATISLLEQAKEEGLIRSDVDLRVFKIMMDAALERLLESDTLKKNKIKYVDALNEVVDILITGIINN